jgi:hypothetical protein
MRYNHKLRRLISLVMGAALVGALSIVSAGQAAACPYVWGLRIFANISSGANSNQSILYNGAPTFTEAFAVGTNNAETDRANWRLVDMCITSNGKPVVAIESEYRGPGLTYRLDTKDGFGASPRYDLAPRAPFVNLSNGNGGQLWEMTYYSPSGYTFKSLNSSYPYYLTWVGGSTEFVMTPTLELTSLLTLN